MMDDDQRKKKKKKSKHRDADYTMVDVDKTVSRAMQQVEQAMKQVKMVTSNIPRGPSTVITGAGAENISGYDGYAQGNPGDSKTACLNLSNKSNTTIHISNSKNVQVGSNNVMIINETGKKKTRKPKQDSSEDEFSDEGAKATGQAEITVTQEIEMILQSDRLVTERDCLTAVKYIGKGWRRFARSLDLSDTDIDIIYTDYGGIGIKEVAYNCLLLWKQRNGSAATLGKLALALRKADPSLYALKELTP